MEAPLVANLGNTIYPTSIPSGRGTLPRTGIGVPYQRCSCCGGQGGKFQDPLALDKGAAQSCDFVRV